MRLHKVWGGVLLAGWLAAYPMGGGSLYPFESTPKQSNALSSETAVSGAALVYPPVPAPNPFSPQRDGKTQLVYQLTDSTDVNIYIYDINGNVVWRQYIPCGQEGARSGLNRVDWSGRVSYNNNLLLPNGVYIAHILIDKAGEKKSLGRAKIVLLN